ncbi:HlyD family efflux transporter periplasmic adaptor subunit [Facilibium subflavum]|uniref:HlyD family efflux transporter periplasmic adaptor subunit n=1 Tax=Facilibium subflavum TaxID=2219058 RepID=UPI000E65B2E8|nr:HlyD family efflux transporter periplasmic adaptor subunit [Facilibium subflavum]
MILSTAGNLPEILPALRSDVKIEQGGQDFNQSPTWLIHDMVNNKFFHIGWKEYEILKYWDAISPDELLAKIKKSSLAEVDENDLEKVLKFLMLHCLVEQGYSELRAIRQRQESSKPHWLLRLTKNYLFFRIPLVHPNAFLDKIYPYCRFVLTRYFGIFMAIFAFIGLLFLLREWDQFANTFFDLFSFRYIVLYIIALVFAKTCHEFGHALMCKKYGLNVPSMGIAFLVLFPMLYTDTTESWKINDPKHRVTISLAGVLMEVYIAILALWLWLILPDGVLKSICFFLATYSLLTTLIINISPFLRFDGYYVLSDLMSMRNLQTRSFALTRWRLRKMLFGLSDPAPEKFTVARQRVLIIYAVLTWVYRFFLFLSIAFVVYYLFFKLLGIILFIIEIIYFILQPIYRELKIWWQLRKDIRFNRNTLIFSIVFLCLLGLLFVPWQSTVSLPATLSYHSQKVFSKIPAKVENIYIKKGDFVQKGQVLVELSSTALQFKIDQERQKLMRFSWLLRNSLLLQQKQAQKNVLENELRQSKTKLNQLYKEQQDLVIKAPFSGVIESLSEDMKKGAWLKKRQAMLVIVDPSRIYLQAYIDEDSHQSLKRDQEGEFVPENIDFEKIPVKVKRIENVNVDELYQKDEDKDHLSFIRASAPLGAYHASNLGGSIVTNTDQEGQSKPQNSVFLLLLEPAQKIDYALPHVMRGKVFIDVDRKSLAGRLWRRILMLWVKESGF